MLPPFAVRKGQEAVPRKTCWQLLLVVGSMCFIWVLSDLCNLQSGRRGSHIQVCSDSCPNENTFLTEESDAFFHYFMAALQHFFTIFKTFLAQGLSANNLQSLTLLFISQISQNCKFSVISIPSLSANAVSRVPQAPSLAFFIKLWDSAINLSLLYYRKYLSQLSP